MSHKKRLLVQEKISYHAELIASTGLKPMFAFCKIQLHEAIGIALIIVLLKWNKDLSDCNSANKYVNDC